MKTVTLMSINYQHVPIAECLNKFFRVGAKIKAEESFADALRKKYPGKFVEIEQSESPTLKYEKWEDQISSRPRGLGEDKSLAGSNKVGEG